MGLLEYVPWKIWITFLIVVLVVMWAVWGGRRDYEIIGLRGISDPPFSDRLDPYSYEAMNPSQRLPEPHDHRSTTPRGWNGEHYSRGRYPPYRSPPVGGDAVVTASTQRSYGALPPVRGDPEDVSDESLLHPRPTGEVSPRMPVRWGNPSLEHRGPPTVGGQRFDSPPPYSTLTPIPSVDLHLPSFIPTQVVSVGIPSPRHPPRGEGPSPVGPEKSHAPSRGQEVTDIVVPAQAVVSIEQQVRLQTYVNPNIARKVSMGEELTTKALETLLGRQVQSQIRPFFLRNPETGRPLELDCYDPVSRIAVEYSGRQHYEFPSSFFTNEQDFYNQVYRDQLKRELCDKNGVYLITVPYSVDMCVDQNCVISVPREIRYERIYNYLKEQLALHANTSLN